MPKHEDRLIGDTEVAAYLGVSRSWVRGQRSNRLHGEPHSFLVDPVYIGTMPRYRLSAFTVWADSLKPRASGSERIPPKIEGKAT